MFGCQQVLIKSDKRLNQSLNIFVPELGKTLLNCGVYGLRQLYFKTGQIYESCRVTQGFGNRESESHYKAFYSDTAQQIWLNGAELFKLSEGRIKGIEGRNEQCSDDEDIKAELALVTFTGRSVNSKMECFDSTWK